MVNVYMDMEFTGLHQNTTLISIGLTSDCGKSFYAEFMDYDKSQVDEWIEKHVLVNLLFKKEGAFIGTNHDVTMMKGNRDSIATALKEWFGKLKDSAEIWGDCLAYDWVLFCQLFGHAFNIPSNIYYIPFDLSTLFKLKGIDPDINRADFVGAPNNQQHNALFDAKMIRRCYHRAMRWIPEDGQSI